MNLKLNSYRFLLFCFLVPISVQAQLNYFESFSNTTAAGWQYYQQGNSPGPRLTANLTPDAVDPEFGTVQVDPQGQGWLRLATTGGFESNGAFFNVAIPAAGNTIVTSFDFTMWNDVGMNNGGDGISVFFADSAAAFNPGANGGSLGYAQKTAINGLAGGYFGVGLDVFGNFSNNGEGRTGGPGGEVTNSQENTVTVRGPGTGTTGYNYLAGTGGRNAAGTGGGNTNGQNFTQAGNPIVGSLETQIAGTNDQLDYFAYTARPDQDATEYRRVEITLDASNVVTVKIEFGFGSGLQTVLSSVDLSAYGTRPENLRIGLAAGTGGATQVYEVRNFNVSVSGGTNGTYWDDQAADSTWGSGTNWNPNGVPGVSNYVYFTDGFATTDSNMTVNTGSDRTVGGIYLSGQYEYTLNNNTITLDAPGAATESFIANLTSPSGSANQTINSNLLLNNNSTISNLTDKSVDVNGTINLQGNTLTVTHGGNVNTDGVISGTGSLIKLGDGTWNVTADNTFSGTVTISDGILNVSHADGLGDTGAATSTTVASGSTLQLSATGTNTYDNENLTIAGAGYGGIGALRNSVGNNTVNGTVTLNDSSTLAAATGTSLTLSGSALDTDGTPANQTLTLLTEGTGSITISKVIQDSSGTLAITKTGTGTVNLSASNTFDGAVNVSAGTLNISNNNALGTTTGATTVSSGATLQLTGGITTPAAETLTLSGTGVSGKASLWSESGTNIWQGNTTISGPSASFGAAAGATLTQNGVISGTGDAIISGTGTVIYGGNNTYTGDTLIQSGTLQFSGTNRIADVSDVVISSGATLNTNSFNDTIGSLAGAGNVTLGSSTLTLGGNNTNTTYSGVASGTGGLIKTGTGTLSVTGANTFSGNLTLTQGSVEISSNNRFDSSSDLVLNGGTFSMTSGADQTFATLTSNAGTSSNLNFNGTSGASTLLIAGTSAANATSTINIQNWSGNILGGGNSQFDFSANAAATNAATRTFFEGWGGTGASNSAAVANGGIFEVVPTLAGFFRWDRADGNWSTAAGADDLNWVGDNGPPDAAAGTSVYFGNDEDPAGGIQNTAAAHTITLPGARTAGTMVIDGSGGRAYNYTAAGADRTLTFDQTGTATAYLTVAGTEANVIGSTNGAGTRVNIALSDNLNISNNSSNALGLTIGTAGGDHTMNLNGNTLTVTGISETVINSLISGTGSIVKNGTGILELTDNGSTYSGGTTLNTGTIQIGADSALGTGTFTINGGTIQASAAGVDPNNQVAINNSFTFSGTNALNFDGTVTSTISSGVKVITVNDVTSSTATDLTFDTNHDLTGAGGITKDGAGTLALTGNNNDFTGGLIINAGTVTSTVSQQYVGLGVDYIDENVLGVGPVTVNSGASLTVLQTTTNAGGDGFYLYGNSNGAGVITNNGGTITVTNSNVAHTNADVYLGGIINNTAGNTSFVDWNDFEVTTAFNSGTVAPAINVSGGSLTYTLQDDFNNATPNSNIFTINVSGTGALNVNLANAEGNSVFQLGTDDIINIDGTSASMVINAGAAAAQVNLAGKVNLSNASTLQVSQGTTLLDSTLELNGGTGTTKGTLLLNGSLVLDNANLSNLPNIIMSSNSAQTISAETGTRNIQGIGTFTKTGTGTTTINASIDNIIADRIVITGGSLLNGASDQIDNDTNMVLSGATYDTGGFDEIVGTLTLTANSTIDLNNGGGTGDSILRFDASNFVAWTPGAQVQVTGWSGNYITGNGTDQIYFGNASSALTTSQLSQIVFINPFGLDPGTYASVILSTGEIVPVPEPEVYVPILLLIALVSWKERKRLQPLLKKSKLLALWPRRSLN